jgi:hypoxanthine phosphoribosyltransferase
LKSCRPARALAFVAGNIKMSSAAPAAAESSASSSELASAVHEFSPAARSLGATTRREPMFLADGQAFALEHFAIPAQYKPFVASVLLPQGMILDRVEKLAADIVEAYPASTPHLLVVLKGGSEFAQDLTHHLRRLHAYREGRHLPFTVDYVRVKSYEGTASTGSVKISGIDMKTVKGRDLILVEDIIDTGTTMSRLIPALEAFGPKSVRVAALLEKRTHKSCGFRADFVGFSVPDLFVVGHNLDYNEAFREMPHICVINAEGIEHFRAFPLLEGACLRARARARKRAISSARERMGASGSKSQRGSAHVQCRNGRCELRCVLTRVARALGVFFLSLSHAGLQ